MAFWRRFKEVITNWWLKDIRIYNAKFGHHTVTLGSLLNYNSTQNASIRGDVGFNRSGAIGTDRLSYFDGSSEQTIANLGDITGGGAGAGAYAFLERIGSNFTLGAAGSKLEFNSLTGFSTGITMPANGQVTLPNGKRFIALAFPKCEFVGNNDRVNFAWFVSGNPSPLPVSNEGTVIAITRTVDQQTGIIPAMAILDTVGATTLECKIVSIAGGGAMEVNTTVFVIFEIASG